MPYVTDANGNQVWEGTTLPAGNRTNITASIAALTERVNDLEAAGGGSGDVTAASAFGTDNRVIRSDGTAKGVQASAVTIDDSGNISTAGTLGAGVVTATLTNCTGLPVSTGVSGLGTGVATALAININTDGAPIVRGGALGIPTSGSLNNCTGLSLATGVTGTLPVNLGGTGVTFGGATTEMPVGGGVASPIVWTTATGSGAPVRSVSPSLTTPAITGTGGFSATLNADSLTAGRAWAFPDAAGTFASQAYVAAQIAAIPSTSTGAGAADANKLIKLDSEGGYSLTSSTAGPSFVSFSTSGSSCTALTASCSNTDSIALDALASSSTGVAVRAETTTAGGIPLKIVNPAGFAVDITSAATADRTRTEPDESGSYLIQESWGVYLRDDFICSSTTTGAIGELGWSASPTAVILRGSEAVSAGTNHPGILRLPAAAGVTECIWLNYLTSGSTGQTAFNGLTMEAVFRVGSITSGRAFFEVGISYVNSYGGSPSDPTTQGYGVRVLNLDKSLSDYWRVKHVAQGSPPTVTYADTGVAAVANEWVRVRLQFTASGTTCTIATTSVPGGATVSNTGAFTHTTMGHSLVVVAKAVTDATTLDLDFVKLYGKTTRL